MKNKKGDIVFCRSFAHNNKYFIGVVTGLDGGIRVENLFKEDGLDYLTFNYDSSNILQKLETKNQIRFMKLVGIVL